MQPDDLIGHYRLERSLGAGAFATVWLARDEYLDDPVAIKVLADNWARNDDIRDRFIDEAKIMRRIDHQRIIRVFAVDELPSGQPMFVMTYADHGTLADAISQRRRESRHFAADEVADLMIELAGCLGVVHDFGVVHRDLKPSNVLFRTPRPFEIDPSAPPPERGLMVLADFGLAKDTSAHSGFTMAAGTPAYMAPEQARTTSDLDPRADVYAATVIAFELLTGVTPFATTNLAEVRDAVDRGAVDASQRLAVLRPDLSSSWRDLIEHGLAIEPSARIDSAAALADAVRSCVGRSSQGGATTRQSQRDLSMRTDIGGLSGQVASLLTRFAGEYSTDIEQRLSGPVRVAVIGSDAEVGRVRSVCARFGAPSIVVLPLADNDVRLGTCDVLLTGSDDVSSATVEVLSDSPSGPIGLFHVDAATTEATIRSVAMHHDQVRASAALAQLDHDVRTAGSVAMSDAWMQIAESVEQLRLAESVFAELAAVRDLVSGRVVLPGRRRDEAIRLLSVGDAAARLSVSDSSPGDRGLRDTAAEQLGVWRSYQDSGAAPFEAGRTIETVIRTLERLWIELGDDITVRHDDR